MEVQCRKEYVSVNLDVDQNGVVHPRFIRWTNGRIYQIDRLKYKCRAASSRVSGGGIRYTVMIHGRCSHPDAAWTESKDSVYRHGQNDHRHAALLLSCLSAASCQRKGQDNEYSEDPS